VSDLKKDPRRMKEKNQTHFLLLPSDQTSSSQNQLNHYHPSCQTCHLHLNHLPSCWTFRYLVGVLKKVQKNVKKSLNFIFYPSFLLLLPSCLSLKSRHFHPSCSRVHLGMTKIINFNEIYHFDDLKFTS
jgi:hypothetical protein